MFEYKDDFLMGPKSTLAEGQCDLHLCSVSSLAEDQLSELAKLVGAGETLEGALAKSKANGIETISKTAPALANSTASTHIQILDDAPALEFDLEQEIAAALNKGLQQEPVNSPVAAATAVIDLEEIEQNVQNLPTQQAPQANAFDRVLSRGLSDEAFLQNVETPVETEMTSVIPEFHMPHEAAPYDHEIHEMEQEFVVNDIYDAPPVLDDVLPEFEQELALGASNGLEPSANVANEFMHQTSEPVAFEPAYNEPMPAHASATGQGGELDINLDDLNLENELDAALGDELERAFAQETVQEPVQETRNVQPEPPAATAFDHVPQAPVAQQTASESGMSKDLSALFEMPPMPVSHNSVGANPTSDASIADVFNGQVEQAVQAPAAPPMHDFRLQLRRLMGQLDDGSTAPASEPIAMSEAPASAAPRPAPEMEMREAVVQPQYPDEAAEALRAYLDAQQSVQESAPPMAAPTSELEAQTIALDDDFDTLISAAAQQDMQPVAEVLEQSTLMHNDIPAVVDPISDPQSLAHDPIYSDPAAEFVQPVADDTVVPLAQEAVTPANENKKRSGLIAAAVIGTIALLGGSTAVGVSWFGGTFSEAPEILASTKPVKVKPDAAGGQIVPNQDSAVFQSSEAQSVAVPRQDKLKESAEEPITVAVNSETGKNEDRIQTTDAETTGGLPVTARRVRTVVVRPDGTIVSQNADQAQSTISPVPIKAPALSLQAPGDTSAADQSLTEVSYNAPKAATEALLQTPDKPASVKVKTIKVKPAVTKAATPKVAAVKPNPVPNKPAPKKVETNTASLPSVSSPYAVQVSSQRSAAAAKTSYNRLSRRYASVIGGKGVDIRKAVISGKGTYYRVRIPAQSRGEANTLCRRLKANGGSCFVTR